MITVRGYFATLAVMLAGLAACGLGGAVNETLDVAAHFAPITFIGGLLCLLFAFSLRSGVLASLIAIGVSVVLMQPELTAASGRPAERGAKADVKVLQYNVWERNTDQSLSAAYINGSGADVVVLEEAKIQAERIPNEIAKVYPYRVRCQEAESLCGVVILSRWPMSPAPLPNIDTPVNFPLAWARVTPPGRPPFEVIGVHYAWPTPGGGQSYQRETLVRLVEASRNRDLIIAGDFNSSPWSFALRRQDQQLGLERRTRALFTWPAGELTRYRIKIPFPFMAIDHVYAGPAWSLVSVERGPSGGSDHYPVLVSLKRTPGLRGPTQPSPK